MKTKKIFLELLRDYTKSTVHFPSNSVGLHNLVDFLKVVLFNAPENVALCDPADSFFVLLNRVKDYLYFRMKKSKSSIS